MEIIHTPIALEGAAPMALGGGALSIAGQWEGKQAEIDMQNVTLKQVSTLWFHQHSPKYCHKTIALLCTLMLSVN